MMPLWAGGLECFDCNRWRELHTSGYSMFQYIFRNFYKYCFCLSICSFMGFDYFWIFLNNQENMNEGMGVHLVQRTVLLKTDWLSKNWPTSFFSCVVTPFRKKVERSWSKGNNREGRNQKQKNWTSSGHILYMTQSVGILFYVIAFKEHTSVMH